MISLFRHCDQGMAGFRYPDGRAYLDQPCVLLDAFGAVSKALKDFRPKQ